MKMNTLLIATVYRITHTRPADSMTINRAVGDFPLFFDARGLEEALALEDFWSPTLGKVHDFQCIFVDSHGTGHLFQGPPAADAVVVGSIASPAEKKRKITKKCINLHDNWQKKLLRKMMARKEEHP